MNANKKIIIIATAVICLLAIALLIVTLALRSAGTVGQEENKSTDTWSAGFSSSEERLAFLAEYLITPGEVLDAEYHIVYHDNSTGLIPGPSDWDVRVALKINPDDIELWLDGFASISPEEIDLTLWDGLSSDSISWDGKNAEYYRREGEFSYLVAFPGTDIILKAVSTMSYPLNTGAAADDDIEVAELRARIHADMPEFAFQERRRVESEYAPAVDRLMVLTDDGGMIASFDLLEYTLWGEPTQPWEERSAIELIDTNFDGYQDIVVFDKPAGNWNLHYIYFLWSPEAETFVHTTQYDHLGLPTFDEEKQLIYSMWRGSAADHLSYIHQYIDGVLTVVEKTSDNYLRYMDGVTDDQLAAIVPLYSECSHPGIQRVQVERLNLETMEMETVEEKYKLYDVQYDWEFVAEYDADSEVGKKLAELINWDLIDDDNPY